MNDAMAIMFIVIGSIIALPLAIVAIIYLVVPIFKAIGFVFKQIFGFIGSTIADIFRFLGAIITSVVLCFLVLGNIIVGRWSASAHFGRAVQSEIATGGHCVYRLLIGNPARALCLTSLTEGLEKRIPQVVAAAPGADQPKGGRLNQFDGYKIIGSLPGGGSGGRLYVAEPDNRKRAIFAKDGQHGVDQVVVKTFSLKEGSTLPQIVRENRALDAAKRLGLILEHDLTPERFYYAMRYVPGENLSLITQRLHAAAGPVGLDRKHVAEVLGYMGDLMSTLRTYHEGGLWHKDVKPDNIIIAGGAAHLVDFGLVTPLRSAMTLTTHGTEYFRDPEMVRMALRGVKVHEVDGAKFDVYAAGAVLFSMIENSFPAHGGLSQLSKKCPESLRWIVRRAMADYEKRYPTARAMLADLAVVAAAADPFAVKLAELPSVAGSDAEIEAPVTPPHGPSVFVAGFPPAEVHAAAAEVRAAAANVRHAQDLPGARGRMRDFFAGVGGKIDDAMAKAGFAGAPGSPPSPPMPPRPRTRPQLRVKSWWKGDYDVIDDGGAANGRGAVAFTPASFDYPAAPGPRRAVPSGIPAAEQLRRARERADAARTRAAARRGSGRPFVKVRAHASGFNPGVAAALFLFLGACVALVAGTFFLASRQINSDGTAPLADGTTWVTLPNGRMVTVPPAPPELAMFASEFTAAFSVLGDSFSNQFAEVFQNIDRGPGPALLTPTAPRTLFVLREPFTLESPARDDVTKVLTRLHALGIEVVGTVDPSLTTEPASSSDALSAELRTKIALAPPTSAEARAAVEAWLKDNPRFDGVLWAVRGDDGDLGWQIVPNTPMLGRAHPTPPAPPATPAKGNAFGIPAR